MRNTKTLFWAILTFGSLLLPERGEGQWEGQPAATYAFINRAPLLDAPVFNADGSRLFGTNFVAMLYGGLTIDSLAPAHAQGGHGVHTPVPFNTTFGPGSFGGPIAEVATEFCLQVPWLQVRAWDLRLGATYEEVAQLEVGGYGESNIFQTRGGLRPPCTDPPTLPGYLFGLESFSLHPVPEPSPTCLLLLGLPLLALRRRLSKRA